MSPAERAAELRSAAVWTVALAGIVAVMILTQAGAARLVGYECEGAAGPIYAAEESDFPPCGQIRPR